MKKNQLKNNMKGKFMMKIFTLLILLTGCGKGKQIEESWQETQLKYKDFNLKVEIKPADRYGYYLVHIVADQDDIPYGEGIHRSREKAIAWALRDLAEELEKLGGTVEN